VLVVYERVENERNKIVENKIRDENEI
jgi:hypothetical protein